MGDPRVTVMVDRLASGPPAHPGTGVLSAAAIARPETGSTAPVAGTMHGRSAVGRSTEEVAPTAVTEIVPVATVRLSAERTAAGPIAEARAIARAEARRRAAGTMPIVVVVPTAARPPIAALDRRPIAVVGLIAAATPTVAGGPTVARPAVDPPTVVDALAVSVATTVSNGS